MGSVVDHFRGINPADSNGKGKRGEDSQDVGAPMLSSVSEVKRGKGNGINTADVEGTGTTSLSSYPKSDVSLVDRFIDEPRPLRVAVIGGGLSGILAGILLPAKVPGIELTIYEKNADFGGTWLENIYPGVRADIPSHVYQATFGPNPHWSEKFAPGAEILEYWQSLARKHDVYRYARFHHRVEDASWDDEASVWTLTVRDSSNGSDTDGNGNGGCKLIRAEADFVVAGVGRFNASKMPTYDGMGTYRGLLRHAANWVPNFDATGKRVAVIGNGATGLQVATVLAGRATIVHHYARNKTWVAPSFGGDERGVAPEAIPSAERATLAADPDAYLAFRKAAEDKYWRRFKGWFAGAPENEALRTEFTALIAERLAGGGGNGGEGQAEGRLDLLPEMLPDFSPNCRRLTPAPGYLEAVARGDVEYVTTPIARFTCGGIETADGTVREVDAVFCATGANVDMIPAFPIRARGRSLREVWEQKTETPAETKMKTTSNADGVTGQEADQKEESKVGKGFAYTYLGFATPDFPNLLFVQGPHGQGFSGTVPHAAETQLTYIAKLLRKASHEGIVCMAPRRDATDDFVAWSDALFGRTVLAQRCRSWYNGGREGGRVHGLWPGSGAHCAAVRSEPRWEDWEYRYLGDGKGMYGNRFAWFLGNGQTFKETVLESDMTPYLHRPGDVDLRDLHEFWWQLP